MRIKSLALAVAGMSCVLSVTSISPAAATLTQIWCKQVEFDLANRLRYLQ